MPKKEITYIDAVKELSKAYGASIVAKLLDTTERGMQYWTASEESKVPREITQRKIHELFLKHQNGEDLSALKSDDPNYKDKYIEALEREKERLRNDLSISLGELRHNILLTRAIAETNQELLVEILSGKNKKLSEQIADNASIKNGERYKRMKEEGSFAYLGK